MMSRDVIEPGFVLALSASPGQANAVVQLIPFALVLANLLLHHSAADEKTAEEGAGVSERAEGR